MSFSKALKSPFTGHALAVLALFLAAFFYFQPFDRPEISFDLKQSKILDSSDTSVIDTSVLKLSEGESVYLVEFLVWNSGQRDLRIDDLQSAEIAFEIDVPIVITNVDTNNRAKPTPIVSTDAITNIFPKLSVDHLVSVNFLYASAKQLEPKVNIEAAGFKSVEVDIEGTSDFRRSAIFILVAIMFFVLVSIVESKIPKWKQSNNPTLSKVAGWSMNLGNLLATVLALAFVVVCLLLVYAAARSFLVSYPAW
tara:strand:+ start:95 stop:850 length:756 start_codon:yes stop_codon:yes gene_type:complete